MQPYSPIVVLITNIIYHMEELNVQWLTEEINGHELNLKIGDTFGYQVPEKGK